MKLFGKDKCPQEKLTIIMVIFHYKCKQTI